MGGRGEKLEEIGARFASGLAAALLTHDNYLRPRLNVLTGRRFRPRGTPPDQCFRRAEA